MKALNLDRLNVRAPYSVWGLSESVYGFKTEHDVLIRIYFDENDTIWQEGAYEFSIINENRQPSPNDRKMRDTVCAVIEELFECNPDILLYQCETDDNKQAARDRLFVRWFKEYAGNDKYVIKVSKVVDENTENYTAIIVQQSNPELNRIITEFDSFMGFLQNKPK